MRAALAIIVLMSTVSCIPNGPATPSQHAVLTSGGVVEYPLPDPQMSGEGCVNCGRATISGMAAGPDGNVWFVDTGHRAVGRITPSGVVTEKVLPTTVGDPYWLATGKDGNVWVTTHGGTGQPDWIVRIGRQDAMTIFQAGTVPGEGLSTGPDHITAGPDGNMWFTEFWANRLGRMAPDGTLAQFSIPTPDSNPRGIVAGPAGSVWFVESRLDHSAIGRMSMKTGVFREFPLGGTPNDQLQPYEIVAGPDGNLWFNQTHPSAAQGEIGRITPSGAITCFTLPKGGRPDGLVAGPDGNVWFTDSGANAVGRISPAGVIHEFGLPRRPATPYSMAAGSDGRIWFAEGSNIAAIGVKVPAAHLSARIVTFGSSATLRAVDVTNIGEAGLKIASVAVSGSDRATFTVTSDACTGRSVAPNSSCRVQLSFAPGSQAGVLAAQLAITDNATGSPQRVSLLAQVPDCKLPLFDSPGTASSSQGKFLSLRDGALVDDPNGSFVTSGTQSNSVAAPVLSGQLPATYDPAVKRWVPVSTRAISPDGSRYAYIDYTQPMLGQVHVVDVGSGLDRTLASPGGPLGVVAFTKDGIYVQGSYERIGPGISIVDPSSGAIRTVLTDSVVHQISGQVAWIVTRNQSDTLPQPGGMGPSYNEVQSRDLKTAATNTWVYRAGSDLYVVGAANGSIVVQVRDQSSTYELVVTAPGQAEVVNVGQPGDSLPFTSVPIADAYGWWMGSLDGLYLWTDHTGAVLVSESTDAPAGACA